MIEKLLSKRYLPLLALLLFSLVFIFSFYHRILLHPNDYMFSTSGDGMKNYFTYAYHIKNSAGLFEFEGMNYPYGENFLYTDCHPVLAVSFKLLAEKFPFFSSHATGILNLLMIFSIFLTFFVCYFLLIELRLDRWFSVMFSMTIGIMAPQIFRLGGHFALSYSLVIPLFWFLAVRFEKRKSGSLILLFINSIFWLFVHAYLGMIAISFLLSYLVFSFALHPARKKQLIRYAEAILVVIASLAFYYLITVLTDSHEGRTSNPSGFFLYNAEPDDLFLPNSKPLRPLFDKISGNGLKLEWEARSYVGLSTTLLSFGILLTGMLSIFRRKLRGGFYEFFNHRILNVSLLAALLCFLFAMGFPFKAFPALLEYMPVIKQFRATGRFAWPLYFVLTSFAAFQFYKIAARMKVRFRPWYASAFILLIFGFNLVEGLPYHTFSAESLSRNRNIFNPDNLEIQQKEALQSIKDSSYQAILPLPFMYIGSESYSRPGNDAGMKYAMLLSYHTGTPILGARLTRTSIEESKRIVQVISPNYYEKALKNDLPSKKPFLIVRAKTSISSNENRIYQKAVPVYSNSEFELLEISYEQVFRDERQTVIDQFEALFPDLSLKDGFYSADTSGFIFYDDFEHSPSGIHFRGEGAYSGLKKGVNTLAEFPPNTFRKAVTYHFSLWMHHGEPDALNLWFRILIEEKNPETGNYRLAEIFPEHSETITDNWSLVEADFLVNDPSSTITIISKGKENSKASLHADDLLIREKGTDIYRLESSDGTRLFYNNHEIKK
ncbi:MAG: hypothetical protein JW801_07485 [Bacteroidales bacterium]|nr:hypothetical protein [Bacteroidales bacterium]